MGSFDRQGMTLKVSASALNAAWPQDFETRVHSLLIQSPISPNGPIIVGRSGLGPATQSPERSRVTGAVLRLSRAPLRAVTGVVAMVSGAGPRAWQCGVRTSVEGVLGRRHQSVGDRDDEGQTGGSGRLILNWALRAYKTAYDLCIKRYLTLAQIHA